MEYALGSRCIDVSLTGPEATHRLDFEPQIFLSVPGWPAAEDAQQVVFAAALVSLSHGVTVAMDHAPFATFASVHLGDAQRVGAGPTIDRG